MRSLLAIALVLLAACSTASDGSPRAASGFVDVPGGPVWYEIMGGGERAPLVVLHGGPGGTSCGLQVLAPLGDKRPVIRYDQLGSGRSGRPTDTSLWNADRFVDELDALRKKLGLERMHLLGHSWGGALAAYYTLEKGGDGVLSLTLSSPLISTDRWLADAMVLRAAMPEDIRAALDLHEKDGTMDSREYQDATEEFYARHVTRGAPVETFQCPDAPGNASIYELMWGPTEFFATGNLRNFDLASRLPDIHVPTLFLTGEFDEARPDTVAAFARTVPGARFEVIPGVAHASFSRAPVHYRKLVRTFIESVENASALPVNPSRAH